MDLGIADLKEVTILDRATEMTFLVGQLKKGTDGWPKGSWIIINPKSEPSMAMGKFNYPPEDLKRRGNMRVSRTTLGLAKKLSSYSSLSGVPKTIDLRDWENPY